MTLGCWKKQPSAPPFANHCPLPSRAEQVWFENRDGIEFDGHQWQPTAFSEDWIFSRRVAQCGGKVMATHVVRLEHGGEIRYSSFKIWGQPRDLKQLHLTII
jgi:hypothetical protein